MAKLASVIAAIAILISAAFVTIDAAPLQPRLGSWVATGNVTAVTGSSVGVLMKDGRTYVVDSRNAQVVIGDRITNYLALRANDIVRVTGTKTGVTGVRADRLVVLPQTQQTPIPVAAAPKPATTPPVKRELEMYGYEQPPVGPPPEAYYAPLPPPVPARPPKPPKPPAPAVTATVRGLVLDMRYAEQTMTVQTSTGSVVVDLAPADIIYAGRTVGIGRLDPGDAVVVGGAPGSNNTLTAARVSIMMSAQTAKTATNVQNVTVFGDIASIDYPSNTLVVRAGSTAYYILADDNTSITNGRKTFRFEDLGPETRVKVRGFGSLATGFAAQEIFVISLPNTYESARKGS